MKVDVDKMKRLMVMNGMSGKALANAIGVSTTAVYKVLHGQNQPKPSTLMKICETLNCDPDDLVKEW